MIRTSGLRSWPAASGRATASSDLVGSGIDVTGPLGSLVVRDVADGASVRAGGTAAQRTTIQARRIGDGDEIRLGSTIAARQIGAVALSRVATDGPSASGVLADDSIRSVVAGSPNMRVSNRTAPGDLGKGQFRVRVV